jgi:hypothetical protein
MKGVEAELVPATTEAQKAIDVAGREPRLKRIIYHHLRHFFTPTAIEERR